MGLKIAACHCSQQSFILSLQAFQFFLQRSCYALADAVANIALVVFQK